MARSVSVDSSADADVIHLALQGNDRESLSLSAGDLTTVPMNTSDLSVERGSGERGNG